MEEIEENIINSLGITKEKLYSNGSSRFNRVGVNARFILAHECKRLGIEFEKKLKQRGLSTGQIFYLITERRLKMKLNTQIKYMYQQYIKYVLEKNYKSIITTNGEGI